MGGTQVLFGRRAVFGHGIWLDDRPGRKPSVVVCDRANKRLQWFTPEGQHLKTLDGFILPANIDTHGDVMLVPDLASRVTLLDKDDKVIVHLGEDPEWRARVEADLARLQEERMRREQAIGAVIAENIDRIQKVGNTAVNAYNDVDAAIDETTGKALKIERVAELFVPGATAL